MEIKFERFHLQADLLSPLKEFEAGSVPTEVRIDPLTKRRSRIITWGLPPKGKFGFSQLMAESKECFFCPEHVLSKTPRFPKEIIPEGRISMGKAVGFPNLSPVGTYGSVVVLCREHFLHLNQFTPEIYERALSLSIEIIRRIMAFDPDTRYWQISQSEQGLGKRFIASTGKIHWFVPFAPLGFNEVCGSIERPSSITTLGSEEIDSLAKGIVSTLQYYADKDLNSFNFSIYAIASEFAFQPLIRIISRTPIQSFYLNDWTSFEVLHSELTSNIVPEELCREIRPYFP